MVDHENEDDDEDDFEETADPGHGDAGHHTMTEEALHHYSLATSASVTSESRPLLSLASPGLSVEPPASLHPSSAPAPSLSHPLYCEAVNSQSVLAPSSVHPDPLRSPATASHYQVALQTINRQRIGGGCFF